MDIITVLLAAFIAACYTTWPNLGKMFDISPGPVCLVVLLVALAVVVAISYKDFGSLMGASKKAILWILVISIANGAAIYLQANHAGKPGVQMGVFFALIYVFQVMIAPALDWAISGEVITLRQLLGLGLSASGIYFLAMK